MDSRATVRTALRAAQVTYDRTGSVTRATAAAVETCRSYGMSYAESERVAQWTARTIRTHHFQN